MFFLAVNIIKKNCVIGKQGFSLFPFFVLGIVPIFANDNYTLTIFSHVRMGRAAPLSGICTGFGAVEAYRTSRGYGPRLLQCASPGERGGAGGWRKLKVPAHRSHASVRGCLYNYRFLWFQSIFLQSSYRSSLTYRRCLRCSRCMRKRR